MPQPDNRPLPLAGIRVLDLSGESAPVCGQVLSLFGAEVVLAEREPSRTCRADFAWLAANAGKRSLALDETASAEVLEQLCRVADVVIDGDPDNPLGFDPRAASPGLIHITVSPFGLAGPHADWLDSELIAQAAGGLLFLSGDADHPPAQIGVPLARGVAGAQAACAVLIALAQRRRTGAGARIDTSRQESVACLLYLTEYMAHIDKRPGQRGEVPLTFSGQKVKRKTFWRCADGYLTWNLWTGPGMGRKNEPVFEWMRDEGVPEAEELLGLPWEKMGTDDLNPELIEQVNQVMGDFFARRTKQEIDREALERRILLFVVQSLEEVANSDQLLAREAFGNFDLPGGRSVTIVSRPARSTAYTIEIARQAPEWGTDTEAVRTQWPAQAPTPAAPSGTAAESLPFAGIRVLDFGWAIVSPLTTRMLSIFGADVVKLEFRGRPDTLRMTGPYPQGHPSMDGSSVYVSVNAGKRSLGIDINHPKGRELLYRMARKADIVCENFTPGTAARLGYGYRDFRAIREDIIMMSLSMQGQTGPRADQPGLGNHLQAMSGLDYLTGFPDGLPHGPNQVLPDFIGPWMAIASLICAMQHRDRTGEGQYLDISQREAIMLYLQPALIEYGITGASPERRGNRSPVHAPHGVYPGKGTERWIAIAVTGDAEWRALHELLPNALRTRFPADLPTTERLARREEMDAALAGWIAGHNPKELADRLQARGVRAHLVCNGQDLLDDPQLAFREHYFTREHSKLGPSLMVANSFRITSAKPRFEPGPRYASNSVEVLEDWLQLDTDEFAELLASEAIVM
ncbi:MAG: CoA transferase [Rhodospirillaceae bacterium]|nr:CoA transferase [Rhodospirillaceae bacterium]